MMLTYIERAERHAVAAVGITVVPAMQDFVRGAGVLERAVGRLA